MKEYGIQIFLEIKADEPEKAAETIAALIRNGGLIINEITVNDVDGGIGHFVELDNEGKAK
jgi:hypothetical protein